MYLLMMYAYIKNINTLCIFVSRSLIEMCIVKISMINKKLKRV